MLVLCIAYTLVLRQMFAHVISTYLELVQNRLHAEFKSSLLRYNSTKTFTLPHLIFIPLLLVIVCLVLILPHPFTPSYRPLVGRHMAPDKVKCPTTTQTKYRLSSLLGLFVVVQPSYLDLHNQPITISFGLGENVAVNSIIGWPAILDMNMDLSIS